MCGGIGDRAFQKCTPPGPGKMGPERGARGAGEREGTGELVFSRMRGDVLPPPQPAKLFHGKVSMLSRI